MRTTLRAVLMICLAFTVCAGALVAQDAPGALSTVDPCVKWAAVIALGISILKRVVPFGLGGLIAKHARIVALILSAVPGFLPLLHGTGLTVAQLVICIGATFFTATGMHTALVKPITDRLASSATEG